MQTTETEIQKCKVYYKGALRKGKIIEKKMDKVKVEFDDPSFLTTWFEKTEVHRFWS